MGSQRVATLVTTAGKGGCGVSPRSRRHRGRGLAVVVAEVGLSRPEGCCRFPAMDAVGSKCRLPSAVLQARRESRLEECDCSAVVAKIERRRHDNCGSAWIRKTLRFWLAERLDLLDDEVKSPRFFHQRYVEVAAFEG